EVTGGRVLVVSESVRLGGLGALALLGLALPRAGLLVALRQAEDGAGGELGGVVARHGLDGVEGGAAVLVRVAVGVAIDPGEDGGAAAGGCPGGAHERAEN